MNASDISSTNENNSWLPGWRHALVVAVLALVGGAGSGGITALKTVGISQDQADVRYLTKSEADQRVKERDRQLELIRKEMLTREVFEAYHSNDSERMNRIEKTLEKLLER